jgi:catechol 2,3-dioxygenase-like lactoylglutathione lyase family enzyme
MTVAGIHHVSFTVADLERTVAFYRDVVGMRLVGRKHRSADDLGTALFGAPDGPGAKPRAEDGAGRRAAPGPAEILIADMELGGLRVEFIQYVRPATAPYPGDPSVAGSAHLAILTLDIESEYRRLQAAGVRFHTPVRTVTDPGRPLWRWCYFRDPDGIVVELVESVANGAAEPAEIAGADGAEHPEAAG